MIDRFIIRPVLKMGTFAKRNPLLTVGMFLAAWFLVRVVLPSGLKATFQGILGMVIGKLLTFLAALPIPGALPLAEFIQTRLVGILWTLFQWFTAIMIGSIFPPLGVFIVAWQITSTLNNGNAKSDLSTSTP